MSNRNWYSLIAGLAGCLWASVALAAVPPLANVDGRLLSAAGGPAADGVYAVAFAVLDGPKGAVLWSEPAVAITVQGGHFSHALGTIKPLSAGLAGGGERWLSVQVGSDPALAAVPLRSVWAAFRAEIAESLACTACIGEGHIDPKALAPFAKTTDLAAFAKSGDLSAYAKATDLTEYVKVNALAKVAGSGSYKDLSDVPKYSNVAISGAYADIDGLPVLAKVNTACGTGLVVKGIKADGSLDCVAGGVTAASLPGDGLDEVSSGTLTNQFSEVAASSAVPIDIPDATGSGVNDLIAVPDFGLATSIAVTVDVVNSNIGNVRIRLYDPAGGEYTVHDQTGNATSLKATFTAASKLPVGDLSVWQGKNPKGNWSINIADLKGTQGGKDGKLVSWSIAIGLLSTKKVAATSALQLAPQDAAPLPCTPSNMGLLYFDGKAKMVRYCDGANWRNLADSCGNGVLEAGEECDDGNNSPGDGCSGLCVASYGAVKGKPGVSCLEIQANWAGKGETAKDGAYWITAPKGQVIQVQCDMTSEGGGYTYLGVASGKTTSRVTDDNTCKDYGLDIVIPRSKAQWSWMLAKYGSDYFQAIPGVYKPSDGGNYTGCVMRHPASYGGGCNDWRVADNGRWWLRDSNYSEPNGDYTANCWLSMYNWDVNDIKFNDGYCGTSTSKYVCSTNDKK